MLKEFSTKLRERSCGEEEYLKKIEVKDFVKYDRDNLSYLFLKYDSLSTLSQKDPTNLDIGK